MIGFFATESHYASHLAPIFHALDRAERGPFVVLPRLVPYARTLGVEPTVSRRLLGELVVVASYGDEVRMRGRRIVLLEHGAGQHYTTGAEANPCYSGGARHSVELFLCPNEAVKRRWRDAYPDSRAEVVGAPKLDPYYSRASAKETPAHTGHDRSSGEARPVVAFAFHWPCKVVPEADTAWPTFGPHLGTLTDRYEVLGHGHPRIFRSLRPHYERMGIEPVADWREVFDRADLLAVDNSSIGPEFASTGKPVLWLNAPHYRKDVWHGGRFWEWPEGQVQCEPWDDLATRLGEALADPAETREAREGMVGSIYAYTDGMAAQRAVDAIASIPVGTGTRRYRHGKS